MMRNEVTVGTRRNHKKRSAGERAIAFIVLYVIEMFESIISFFQGIERGSASKTTSIGNRIYCGIVSVLSKTIVVAMILAGTLMATSLMLTVILAIAR